MGEVRKMDEYIKNKVGIKKTEGTIEHYLENKKKYDTFVKEKQGIDKYKRYQKEITNYYKK